MRITPNAELTALLQQRSLVELLDGFDVDDVHLAEHRALIDRDYPASSEGDREALAAYATYFHPCSPHNAGAIPDTSQADLSTKLLAMQVKNLASSREALVKTAQVATDALVAAIREGYSVQKLEEAVAALGVSTRQDAAGLQRSIAEFRPCFEALNKRLAALVEVEEEHVMHRAQSNRVLTWLLYPLGTIAVCEVAAVIQRLL